MKVIITEKEIQNRVTSLAEEISKDFAGEEVVAICMLKGGVFFFSDLVKQLKIPVAVDFARISSYRNGTTSGQIEVLGDISINVQNKRVLIVEDIVDSGKTLYNYLQILKEKKPASISVCSLLDKPHKRVCQIPVDYVGFTGEFGFVVGYGLDFAERFRELPYVAVMEADDLKG